jgi:anaerobic selenocysteine-containing dehydrogenase
MGKEEEKKAVCFYCKPHCRTSVHVKDNRLIRVDPAPYKGCRAAKAVEWFYHPDRLKFPLKRVGERGEGKWEKVSWEQGLDEVADKLLKIKERYGAEAVAAGGGTSRTYEEFRQRFMYLFGSPNIAWGGQQCHGNSAVVASMTYGWFPHWSSTARLDQTKCIMLIGRNPPPSFQQTWEGIIKAKQKGSKLIVIDPRNTETAKNADIFLQLRPGTDCALLMSMVNVIIESGIFDKDFVNEWCYGFDKLAERARDYPPETVSEITWIPQEKIREAALMFATNRPSCAVEGMGIAQQSNSTHALHAKYILSAIVGNIDVEGGDELLGPAPFITEHEMELPERLSEEQWEKLLGSDRYRLYSRQGYRLTQPHVEQVWGKRCDMVGLLAGASVPATWRAMAFGEPYPVKGFITVAGNQMLSQTDTKLIYKALKSLDLLVAAEFFLTPTAQLADYVFPASSWMERPHLYNYHNVHPLIVGGEGTVPEIIPSEYDRRNDYYFWRGLALRLGQNRDWPWETIEECYDYRLEPLGFTFREFLDQGGVYNPPRRFKKYEHTGFGTPTGKIELYSTVMEELGYDPLPHHKEPAESPVSQPKLAEEYPLILTTGGRFLPYFHSEWRQIDSYRNKYPHPIVEIHPETAGKLGIDDGAWVWIESPRGRIMQKCRYFNDIDPRVVHAQHGWWYPELPGEEPWLHGVWISNVNVLTNSELDQMDDAIGTWPFKNLMCKVYKVRAYAGNPPLPHSV